MLRAEDSGFEVDGLAVLEVRTPGATTPAEAEVRHDALRQRLAQVPSVIRVATMGVPLLDRMYGGTQFEMPEGAERMFANDIPVSPEFFDVMRLELIAGRVLTEEEIVAGRPLAVVSEVNRDVVLARCLGRRPDTDREPRHRHDRRSRRRSADWFTGRNGTDG